MYKSLFYLPLLGSEIESLKLTKKTYKKDKFYIIIPSFEIIEYNQTGSGASIVDYSITSLKTSLHVVSMMLTGQDEIVSIVSVFIDIMTSMGTVLHLFKSANDFIALKKLLEIKFTTPEEVNEQTLAIVNKLNDKDKIRLCKTISTVTKQIAMFAGDLVDIITPDTGGEFGNIIQYAIIEGNGYVKLKEFYNHLPKAGKSIFSHPEILEQKLLDHLKQINDLIEKLQSGNVDIEDIKKDEQHGSGFLSKIKDTFKKIKNNVELNVLLEYRDRLKPYIEKVHSSTTMFKKCVSLLFVLVSIECNSQIPKERLKT